MKAYLGVALVICLLAFPFNLLCVIGGPDYVRKHGTRTALLNVIALTAIVLVIWILSLYPEVR